MNWEALLEADERICWEGRPAPRCYTFRNWKHSLFGVLLTLFAAWWQVVGIQLSEVYGLYLLTWLPVPFWLLGIYLAIGHLLLARLEWERVAYAVTDRRLLVRRGIRGRRVDVLPLTEVGYFRLHLFAPELGAVQVHSRRGGTMVRIQCIEYPRRLTSLLEDAMRGSGVLVADGESD